MAQSQTRMGKNAGQSSGQGPIKDKVQDLAGQAGDQVSQVTERAQDQVKSQVTDRSTQLGEQIGSTAGDLRSVAEGLRNRNKEQPAKLAEQAADKADQFADYLKRSDGQTLLRDVEDFGRRQPWAVVAGGLAIGFLASRFLKSSSSNRFRSSTGGHRGLEYDGPVQSSDAATATYVPPIDEAASSGTSSAADVTPAGTGSAVSASNAFDDAVPGNTGGEDSIGAGPGGSRLSAPPAKP